MNTTVNNGLNLKIGVPKTDNKFILYGIVFAYANLGVMYAAGSLIFHPDIVAVPLLVLFALGSIYATYKLYGYKRA